MTTRRILSETSFYGRGGRLMLPSEALLAAMLVYVKRSPSHAFVPSGLVVVALALALALTLALVLVTAHIHTALGTRVPDPRAHEHRRLRPRLGRGDNHRTVQEYLQTQVSARCELSFHPPPPFQKPTLPPEHESSSNCSRSRSTLAELGAKLSEKAKAGIAFALSNLLIVSSSTVQR